MSYKKQSIIMQEKSNTVEPRQSPQVQPATESPQPTTLHPYKLENSDTCTLSINTKLAHLQRSLGNQQISKSHNAAEFKHGMGSQHNKLALTSVVHKTLQRDDEKLDTKEASEAIAEWVQESTDYLTDNRTWYLTNWSEVLTYTAGSKSSAWELWLSNTGGNLLGNGVSEGIALGYKLARSAGEKAGKGLITTACTSLGTLIGTPLGGFIGFALGVMIETIISVLTDSSESERMVGRKQMNSALKPLFLKTNNAQKRAGNLIKDSNKEFGKLLLNLKEQKEVDDLTSWIKASTEAVKSSKPNPEDLSLFRRVIRDWILENAGDEENPGNSVEKTGWNEAVKYAVTNKFLYGRKSKLKPLDDIPDLDYHPELFAYQTRRQWRDAGLGEFPATKMIKKVNEIRVKDRATDPAKAVMGTYDGQIFTFSRIENPQKFIQFLWQKVLMFPAHRVFVNQDVYRQKILVNSKLELSTSDNSVYVDKWKYRLVITNPNTRLALGWNEHRFETSP